MNPASGTSGPDTEEAVEAVSDAEFADRQRAIRELHEPERLEALRQSGLLDSEVEEEFDRLTRLAAKLLGAPATFFSLVDEDRDFYKSCFGFAEPIASAREIEGTTFCHYALVSDGALVIPDTRADPLYRTVPTVESMGVAAYIGVPIRSPDGYVLGSFCAIDFEPRDWTPLEIEVMKELAKSAEREVALRDWMRRQNRLVEQEREARRELEEVMDSRARLIRGFSHDVKNPLGAADGFLALLEDGILGELAEKQTTTVQRTRRILRDALRLIEDVLEIARAENQELGIEMERVDLARLARQVTEEYRPQAMAKGLDLRCQIGPGVLEIRSDESRIRQILGNLISNGLKYTSEGGVTIAARRDEALREFCIEVSDTGSGIPEDRREVIFREFTRLDPEAVAGAGLGLAISQRLAEALGGRITVRDADGGGSLFSLHLPED